MGGPRAQAPLSKLATRRQADPAHRGCVISVVIPAHNEESVIGRCLSVLVGDTLDGEIEVVVVCNGCTDGTFAVASAFGPPVKVFDLPTASKCLALNLGDSQVVGFPRFYVDADVELDMTGLREVAAVLTSGEALVASPRRSLDLSGRPLMVRAYYRIWSEVPGVKDQISGSGVYAVGEAGRGRFDRFPEIIADDAFVPALFAPEEHAVVSSASSVVHPPLALRDIVRAKTRTFAGNLELKRLLGNRGYLGVTSGSGRSWQKQVLENPKLLPSVIVYVGVNFVAKVRAHRRLRQGGAAIWDRDERSRSAGDRPAP